MKLKRALSLRVLPMLLVATGISSAATVVLDATKQGAVFTTFLIPGGTVTSVDLPIIQLTLGPGTYAITDGDTSTTGSAWNWSYSGTGSQSNGNWIWDFAAVNDATKVVLLNDYIGTAPGTVANFSSRALAAQATGAFYNGNTLLSTTSTALFSGTLTLASSTVVDFFVPDGNISDNLGGMTLNVTQVQTGVPEPASFLLVVTALAAGCLRLRRRAG
jgi:hypothetical protein